MTIEDWERERKQSRLDWERKLAESKAEWDRGMADMRAEMAARDKVTDKRIEELIAAIDEYVKAAK